MDGQIQNDRYKLTEDEVGRLLAGPFKNMPCRFCGSTKWSHVGHPQPDVFSASIFINPPNAPFSAFIPQVVFECGQCGLLEFFSAGALRSFSSASKTDG